MMKVGPAGMVSNLTPMNDHGNPAIDVLLLLWHFFTGRIYVRTSRPMVECSDVVDQMYTSYQVINPQKRDEMKTCHFLSLNDIIHVFDVLSTISMCQLTRSSFTIYSK